MAEIVVVGSLNMDLVVRCPRRPRPGETVLGSDFATFPGGKGANQAVAAARAAGAGTRPGVAMVGRVGADAFGEALRRELEAAGVDTSAVGTDPDEPTGVAVITVDAAGENAIVVAPGANARLSPDHVRRARPLLSGARYVLLQLEIPVETVAFAVALAREAGARVILDPAPAPGPDFPRTVFRGVEVITPNEREAEALTGISARDPEGARAAARALLEQGCRHVAVTLGARGAVTASAGEAPRLVPAFRVPAVDSTAAGDAFAGALAVALAEGRPWDDAVRFGQAAGALAVTRRGAQASLADRAAIEAFLASHAPLGK